ncbi:hypothetical protein HYH02_001047 [Chlamydomonas schloesseri]|uniref:Uncharacterized protein n=1 Tax=Chlamydomonas schloesseri TaxID=2026947 RepID=A0A835WTM9_9CHLO|nr:hypothetical protein HYH02_001047 [Chlamydomonas schloesseri]|eukprot:KAG2454004.1 hypothetical protein HYH02_001047 [Chlamydomonas schloesseri]
MRAVAAQSILDQHCSPQLLWLLEDATRVAVEQQRLEMRSALTGSAGSSSSRPAVVTSAHLALAALAADWEPTTPAAAAAGDATCCGVRGVLHHSAGLTLLQCARVLAARVAEEEGGGSGVGGREREWVGTEQRQPGWCYSPAAQHFLMQAYRWAVFTGCDMVQPCHLLWALAADPRAHYSAGRTDPLSDGCVVAAEEWVPPLVWLLERAEGLTRPARVYEQDGGDGPADPAVPHVVGHRNLHTRLNGPVPNSMEELCGLLRSCRETGLVPSRRQLQALGSRLKGLWNAKYMSSDLQTQLSPPPPQLQLVTRLAPGAPWWPLFVEALEAFAALGYRPPPLLPSDRAKHVHGSYALPVPPFGAAAASNAAADTVLAWCGADAVLRFCLQGDGMPYDLSSWLSSEHALPPELLDRMPSFNARAQQALLALADHMMRLGTIADTAEWAAPFVRRCAALHREAAAALISGAGSEDGSSCGWMTRQTVAAQRRCLLAFLASPSGTWLLYKGLCRIEDFGMLGSCGGGSRVGGEGTSSSATVEAALGLREAVPLERRAWLLDEVLITPQRDSSTPKGDVARAWKAAVWASLAGESCAASIRATISTQCRMAAGLQEAHLPVPVEWLKQLASYAEGSSSGSSSGIGSGSSAESGSTGSSSSSGSSSGTSNIELVDALELMLDAAAEYGVAVSPGVVRGSVPGACVTATPIAIATSMALAAHAVPAAAAPAGGAAPASPAGAWAGSSSTCYCPAVDPELLGQLAAMVEASAAAGFVHMSLDLLHSLNTVAARTAGAAGTAAIRLAAARTLAIAVAQAPLWELRGRGGVLGEAIGFGYSSQQPLELTAMRREAVAVGAGGRQGQAQEGGSAAAAQDACLAGERSGEAGGGDGPGRGESSVVMTSSSPPAMTVQEGVGRLSHQPSSPTSGATGEGKGATAAHGHTYQQHYHPSPPAIGYQQQQQQQKQKQKQKQAQRTDPQRVRASAPAAAAASRAGSAGVPAAGTGTGTGTTQRRWVTLRGRSIQLYGQAPPPDASATLPRAEHDAALAAKLRALGWQELSAVRPPHRAGVYWLGLRHARGVTPLYHGQGSYLDERLGAHRQVLEGRRGLNSKRLYWGLRLAAVVGTVVVAYEPTPGSKPAEAAELARRNYAFNTILNGGTRVREGLRAVGLEDWELNRIWSNGAGAK